MRFSSALSILPPSFSEPSSSFCIMLHMNKPTHQPTGVKAYSNLLGGGDKSAVSMLSLCILAQM